MTDDAALSPKAAGQVVTDYAAMTGVSKSSLMIPQLKYYLDKSGLSPIG